jgi:hypothetical protein
MITKYVAHRQASKTRRGTPPANGTINRELSLLGTMLRLATRRRKVLHPPPITLLKETAPRACFFEPHQFAAVRRRLRQDLQLAVDLAYTYGWRVRDEVLTLARRHVDLAAGTIRLAPGESKNEDGRIISLTPEIADALRAQLARVDRLGRKLGQIVPWVFAHAADGPLNPKTGKRSYVAGDRVEGLPSSLGDGLQERRLSRDAAARLPADGGAQPRERRDAGEGRHDDHRAQDPFGVRPLPHRGARGFAGGRPADRSAREAARGRVEADTTGWWSATATTPNGR